MVQQPLGEGVTGIIGVIFPPAHIDRQGRREEGEVPTEYKKMQ